MSATNRLFGQNFLLYKNFTMLIKRILEAINCNQREIPSFPSFSRSLWVLPTVGLHGRTSSIRLVVHLRPWLESMCPSAAQIRPWGGRSGQKSRPYTRKKLGPPSKSVHGMNENVGYMSPPFMWTSERMDGRLRPRRPGPDLGRLDLYRISYIY